MDFSAVGNVSCLNLKPTEAQEVPRNEQTPNEQNPPPTEQNPCDGPDSQNPRDGPDSDPPSGSESDDQSENREFTRWHEPTYMDDGQGYSVPVWPESDG